MKPDYLKPDSKLTLREALAEYYEINTDLLSVNQLPADAAKMFQRHDAGHVVFGCDTSLRGEALIDTWTVVATTAGLKGYLEYFKYPQVNAIFKEVGYLTILIESCKVLPDVGRVIYRGFRQRQKWPWNDFAEYLDENLLEIRTKFGIAIV